MKTEQAWDKFFPSADEYYWDFYTMLLTDFLASVNASWSDVMDHDLMMIGGGEL